MNITLKHIRVNPNIMQVRALRGALFCKDSIMASFIQPGFPSHHAGGVRFESALASARALRRRFDSAKGLSAMLLAAMLSALVVVADQLIETWVDGGLMVAWVALWLLGFGALAMFSLPARKWTASAMGELKAWSGRVAQRRADERLWALARTDARVMADLDAARARSKN